MISGFIMAVDGNINIAYDHTGLDSIVQGIREISAQMGKLDDIVKITSDQLRLNMGKVNKLFSDTRSLENYHKQIRFLNKSGVLDKLNIGLKKTGKMFDKATKDGIELNDVLGRISTSLKPTEIAKFRKEWTKFNRDFNMTDNQIKDMNNSLKEFNNTQEKIKQQMKMTDKEIKQMVASLKKFNNITKASKNNIKGFGDAVLGLRGPLRKVGLTIDQDGIIKDKNTGKTVELLRVHKLLKNQLKGTAFATKQLVRNLNILDAQLTKNQLKTNSAKESVGRFKMELLGIMFFGMAMSAMFMGMLQPAMDTFGIFDLITNALKVGFIPVMEKIQPIIMTLANLFMDSPDWFKGMVGGIAVIGALAGTFLFLAGQLALGLDSIGKWKAAHKTFVGGFKKIIMWIGRTIISLGKYLLQVTRMIIMKVAGAFSSMYKGLITVRKGTVSARAGMLGLNASMLPIIAAIAVLAIIIVFFYLAWKNNWGNIHTHFKTFKKGFDNIVNGFKMVLSGFIKFFKGVFTGDFKGAIEGLKEIWEGLKTMFIKGLGAIIIAGNLFVIDLAKEIWDGIDKLTGGMLTRLTDAASDIKDAFWNMLPDWVQDIIKGVSKWAGAVKDAIMDAVGVEKIPEIKVDVKLNPANMYADNLLPQSQNIVYNTNVAPEVNIINGTFTDKTQVYRTANDLNTVIDNALAKANITTKKV